MNNIKIFISLFRPENKTETSTRNDSIDNQESISSANNI